jgi:hypothetical protein
MSKKVFDHPKTEATLGLFVAVMTLSSVLLLLFQVLRGGDSYPVTKLTRKERAQ